jgi:hypothetical protein
LSVSHRSREVVQPTLLTSVQPLCPLCLCDGFPNKFINHSAQRRTFRTTLSSGKPVAFLNVRRAALLRAERFFQVSAAKRMFVLEVGGLLQKRARSPPAQTSEGDVMKTLIRVVKRRSEDNKHDSGVVAPAKSRLTTEMIVKSWIIESREQRQAAMSRLQSSFSSAELGGLARG